MSTSRKSRARSSRAWSRRARDERGAALVLFALSLPVLVLMMSFVLDVGNWFAHKRHLQMQADASALAAAMDLRTPCSDTVVQGTATSYGGGDWNAQIQNRQSSVHMKINSQTYYNQDSGPIDTTAPTDPPCTAHAVDVKLTEVDLPWYFKIANVPFINAHARVGLFTVDSYTGSLPLAVPDVDPHEVLAQFVDEDTGQVLGTKTLTRVGEVGGLVHWDNADSPLSVTFNAKHVGVRVITTRSSSTTCGDALVNCYDAGSTKGLVYIRGWTRDGTPSATTGPIARSVSIEPAVGCDGYFNYGAACNVGLRATVDIGTEASADVKLTAVVGNQKADLVLQPDGTWLSPASLTIASRAGPVPIELTWEVKGNTPLCSSNGKCTGTFGNVQRTFSGTDTRSGPIRLVDVSENGVPDVNSVERCGSTLTTCTHDLVVTVGLLPGLEVAQSINDPVVKLRFSGGGSQSQGLDCDDNDAKWGNPNAPGAIPNFSLFDEEIAWGCRPSYAPNQGTACPANASALWSTPNPPSWTCVATQTGQYVNKIGKGLNQRILCPKPDWGLAACADPTKPTACTHPNNWSQFTTGLPLGDPRIVQLFITQYGVFDPSGSSTVPVVRFATFYVTGWNGSGGGFPNPCQGNGDDAAADGEIVGHFIKYIDTLGTSTGSTPCDFSDPSPCVPVLTD
jgi:Flp pilus assembly protein TadG